MVLLRGGRDAARFKIRFDRILAAMDAFSSSRQLRKLDGLVFAPVPDCPLAYRELCTYEQFVNMALRNEPEYRSHPDNFDDAIRYLEISPGNISMPLLRRDRNLLSFTNGVLNISSMTFIPREDDAALREYRAPLVARHHIPMPFTASRETPLLDLILLTQFTPEVADVLCAMLGRAFFEVNELDDWHVYPHLTGDSATGKSVLLKVLRAAFSPRSVATLGPNPSQYGFNLDDYMGHELVIGNNMQEKMSEVLSRWKIPLITCGNYMPDYSGTNADVGRHIVIFRFQQDVNNPMDNLDKMIIDAEIPAFVARCIGAYHDLRGRVKSAGGLWSVLPQQLHQWHNDFRASASELFKFLTMFDDDRGWCIERVPGAVTSVKEFKLAFEKVMRSTLDIQRHRDELQEFSYRLDEDRIHDMRLTRWELTHEY
jgi:hypothetical protein